MYEQFLFKAGPGGEDKKSQPVGGAMEEKEQPRDCFGNKIEIPDWGWYD